MTGRREEGRLGLDELVLSSLRSLFLPPLQMTGGARQWKVRCVVLRGET